LELVKENGKNLKKIDNFVLLLSELECRNAKNILQIYANADAEPTG
jgi:hypothetical protein